MVFSLGFLQNSALGHANEKTIGISLFTLEITSLPRGLPKYHMIGELWHFLEVHLSKIAKKQIKVFDI